MVLTFRSSTPETFELINRGSDGRSRSVTATRQDDNLWDIQLRHPSGDSWDHRFCGGDPIDTMHALMASKTPDYRADGGRGDRPAEKPYDPNRPVNDGVATRYYRS